MRYAGRPPDGQIVTCITEAQPDMADTEDAPNEFNLIRARFLELGGGSTIDMDLADMPPLAELVMPKHRQMVKDLAAGGMSQEHTALVMGISKERLQHLFPYELEVGFSLAESTLSRTLYKLGAAGNQTAATNWLRYHKKSQWSDKKEMTDKGAEQERDINSDTIEQAQDVLAKLLSGMAVDQSLKRAPRETKAVVGGDAKIVQAKIVPKSVKRAKGD